MFMAILTSAIASTIPFFLYFTGNCELKYFVYFIFAKIAFWSGFAINYKINSKYKPFHIDKEEAISYRIYLFFYFVSITLKLISYILLGIPLLLSNRQDLYINAGGLAILDKISFATGFYCLIYSFYLLKKKTTLAKTYIIYSVITGLLSGSKGFILNICAAYYIYKVIHKEEKIIIPTHILLMILASPIVILLISGFSSNIYIALYDYIFRIVAYGDVYWYSFPSGTIEHVHIENPLRHLFSGFLGPLRLINYETDGIPIGRFLYWETMPKEYHNIMGGPNARPVVLSYILFKHFGIISCYIFGYIMSYLMTHIKKHLPKSIISSIIIGSIYVFFLKIATDPVMAFNGIFSTLLLLTIIIFSLFLIQRKYRLKKMSYESCTLTKKSLLQKQTQVKVIMFMLFLIISILMTTYN